jgi:hypothetical protein
MFSAASRVLQHYAAKLDARPSLLSQELTQGANSSRSDKVQRSN